MESEPPLPDYELVYGLFIGLSDPVTIGFAVVFLLILLCCSALISGSEVAYFSLTPQEVHNLRDDLTSANQRILHLRTIPRKLLATILISNNFVNVAIVILSEYVLWNSLPESTFQTWAEALSGLPVLSALSVPFLMRTINFVITVAGVTFLLVLFGEVAPKIYAKINNVRLARFMSRPLQVLVRLFAPVSVLLVNWSLGIERRFSSNGGMSLANKEDIDKAIDLAVSKDSDSKLEADILKSIVKFNDVMVKQIMRARVDVIAADHEMSYKDLLKLIKSSGYSRIPVYQDEFDNIIGILYVKDLIGHRDAGKHFEWQNLVRPNLLYVPESKKINDLLKDFQQERVHMAIVVDEYGGSAGVVTLEDVMEQVVGEIKDEFDEEREAEYKQIDEHNFLFDGKMLLNDVSRILDIDVQAFDAQRGEADSLAGLILELNGELPLRGEVFTVGNLELKVVSVTKRRIEKIRMSIHESDEDD